MSDSELGQLVDSYLDLKWHIDPVEATGAGLQEHDHRLGAFGGDELKQVVASLRSLSGALEAVATDSIQDEIDRTALLNDLRVTIHKFEQERQQERDPVFWVSHVLEGLYLLLALRDRSPEHRSRAAAERLKAVPAFLDLALDTVRRSPAILMEAAADVALSGSALVDQVTRELDPGDDADFESVGDAAQESLVAFSEQMRDGAQDARGVPVGVGEDSFNFRLHYQHALQASAAQLWRFGESLIEQTERDLAGLAAEIDPGTAWPDLVEMLRMEHPEADDLVSAYGMEMARSRQFVLEHDLVDLPIGQLEVVSTPDFLRPLIPFAAYQPPGAFSSDRTGWFYVTQPDSAASVDESDRRLRDHCVHEIACTALHEGYPGHHLQFLSAQALPQVVRKVVHSPLMVEGWALFCEEMMGEHGFYRGKEEQLFRLLALLWRAVRVVIDVGLHTRRMTTSEAVAMLVDKIHFDSANAEAEVRRYCAQPTYQLCYAVGCHEIIALRSDYRRAAGSDYSEKRFHTAVLAYGGLPTSLVRWGMGLND